MENNEENKETVETLEESTTEQNVTEVSPNPEIIQSQEQSIESLQEEPEKEKKNNKWPIIILLLLLVAAGVALYFLVLNKPESKTIKKKAKNVKSEYRISGNDLQDFDLYFLKLENEAKNKVYSPLSIKYALAMLSAAANGETKTQIDNIIGDYQAKKYPNNEHMSFANAMFIRDTYKDKIKEEYTKTLTDKYNAEIITDPFANPDNINNWVSNKTFNLINNLIDDVSDNDFFLINALAIDMNWNNQIHCATGHKIPCINNGTYSIEYKHEILDDDSKENYSITEYPYCSEDNFYGGTFNGKENTKGGGILADFNKYDIIKDLGEDKIKEIIKPEYEQWLQTEDGKGDLPYDQFIDKFINELKENYGKAANSTDFLVYEDDNVKEFAKDLQEYDETTLQYIGIMPKNEELTEFIKNSDKDSLTKLIKALKEVKIDSFEEGYATRIRGFIPFFKFDSELKLMEDLQKLGVKDVFSDNADLSNLSEDAIINEAVHKANIEFSNDGIKASAATSIGGFGAAHGPYFEHLFKIPVKEIDMNFNKPYMYIIRDKATGEVWFTGTVYEPITK